jgi:hypothetical protein
MTLANDIQMRVQHLQSEVRFCSDLGMPKAQKYFERYSKSLKNNKSGAIGNIQKTDMRINDR